jgi:hypothetical protein
MSTNLDAYLEDWEDKLDSTIIDRTPNSTLTLGDIRKLAALRSHEPDSPAAVPEPSEDARDRADAPFCRWCRQRHWNHGACVSMAGPPHNSCLICGQLAPLVVWYGNVGVCEVCRNAALRTVAPASTQEGLLAGTSLRAARAQLARLLADNLNSGVRERLTGVLDLLDGAIAESTENHRRLDERFAAPASEPTPDLRPLVFGQVLEALWSLPGYSHETGNSVVEDILAYAYRVAALRADRDRVDYLAHNDPPVYAYEMFDAEARCRKFRQAVDAARTPKADQS